MKPTNVQAALSAVEMSGYAELGKLDGKVLGIFRTPADTWIWERHPDGDELLLVLEGSFEMTLLHPDGPAKVELHAGEVFVVPAGVWHRPHALSDASVLFATPSATQLSQHEDPTQDPDVEEEAL